jgi:WD40 repeat protein
MVLEGPVGIRSLNITNDGSLLEAAVLEEGYWVPWVWSLSEESPRFLRQFNLGETGRGGWRWGTFDRKVARWCPDMKTRIWSMDAPADDEPLILLRGDNQQINGVSFNPRGGWLATADAVGLALWPLGRDYPVVIRQHKATVFGLAFAPDGRWIASSSGDNTVRLWPLDGNPPPPGKELGKGQTGLAVSPDGERILVGTNDGSPWVFSHDGDPPRNLAGFYGQTWAVAFSPDGRLAAAAGGLFDPAERVIHVWDVASGERVTALEIGERPVAFSLQFTDDGHLLSMSESGLLRWDVDAGTRELLHEGNIFAFSADSSGRRVMMVEREDASDLFGHVLLLELDAGVVSGLGGFGSDVSSVALDPTGTLAVTGDKDGEIRVGSLNGEDPHLLFGHETMVWSLAIDPLNRWVASGSEDTTIRLWPMPDLSKPPLHTLPHDELIAKLKTLTNLRVVRDEQSATGWKLTHDPFPGWETVPSW